MKKLALIIPILLATHMACGATIQLYGGGSNTTSEPRPLYSNASIYYKCSTSISFDCNNYAGIIITYTGQTGGSGTATNPYILTGCSKVECACNDQQYTTSSGCSNCTNNRRGLQAPTIGLHTATACYYCQPEYWQSQGSASGAECSACPDNAICDGSTAYTCKSNYLRKSKECVNCPDNAICDGSTTFQCTSGYYYMYYEGANMDPLCAPCPGFTIPMCNKLASTAGATSVSQCYVPSGTSCIDNTGNFDYVEDCYY